MPSGMPRSLRGMLGSCSACRSARLQPGRCRTSGRGELRVEYRCAECGAHGHAVLTRAEARELDRAQAQSRAAIQEAYTRTVTESMEELAASLTRALELDLLSADDFAPRPLRRVA